MAEPVRRTIHYTEFTDLAPDNPIYEEWKTYRQVLPRLLAEGKEGKFVLIKGSELIGIYESWREADKEGLSRYLRDHYFLHQS